MNPLGCAKLSGGNAVFLTTKKQSESSVNSFKHSWYLALKLLCAGMRHFKQLKGFYSTLVL